MAVQGGGPSVQEQVFLIDRSTEDIQSSQCLTTL